MITPVRWEDGRLVLIDQTRLPTDVAFRDCHDLDALGVPAREHLRHDPAHRRCDDDEWRRKARAILQHAKFVGERAHGRGPARRIAPADALAIVAAHARARGELGAKLREACGVAERAVFEDDGRRTASSAQKVQPARPNVYEDARRWKPHGIAHRCIV